MLFQTAQKIFGKTHKKSEPLFFWESTLKDVQRSNIIGKPFKVVSNWEFLLWGPIYTFRPLPAISKIQDSQNLGKKCIFSTKSDFNKFFDLQIVENNKSSVLKILLGSFRCS